MRTFIKFAGLLPLVAHVRASLYTSSAELPSKRYDFIIVGGTNDDNIVVILNYLDPSI